MWDSLVTKDTRRGRHCNSWCSARLFSDRTFMKWGRPLSSSPY